MKKILSIVILSASVCACSRNLAETEQTRPQQEGGKQIITATVNAATKLAFSEAASGGGSGLSSKWEEGDSFLAIQDGTTGVKFTLCGGAGTSTATFYAETEGVTDETSWTAVLGNKAVSAGSGKEIHGDYMDQKGTLAGLDDVYYVKASGTGETPTFDFANGTKFSYVLRVKLPAGIKCIEYTPSAWWKLSSSSNETVYYNGDEQNDFGPTYTSTITLDSQSSKGDIVYIALPSIDLSTGFQNWNDIQNGNYRTGIIITLLNDTSDNATMSTGWVWGQHREGGDISEKGGMIKTVDMSGMTLYSRPMPSEATEISTTDVSLKLHDALTQSTSSMDTWWAPYNIGASKVSEKGLYVAWGEYWDNGTYTWEAYQQRHRPSGTYRDDITTPTTAAIGSNQNNYYSIAGSRYDAARVLWGSAWRMPHAVEIWGFVDNGTKSYQTIDGVTCVVYTVGGNSVIFPPTGCYRNNTTCLYPDCAWVRSADKLQRTYSSSNEIYRQNYSLWSWNSAAETLNDPDGFSRSQGFYAYPVRAVLAKSTIVGK